MANNSNIAARLSAPLWQQGKATFTMLAVSFCSRVGTQDNMEEDTWKQGVRMSTSCNRCSITSKVCLYALPIKSLPHVFSCVCVCVCVCVSHVCAISPRVPANCSPSPPLLRAARPRTRAGSSRHGTETGTP
eukprot:2739031-Rhodomonas_salina.1